MDKDLKGKRFSRLVVVKKHDCKTHDYKVIWQCKCDCGNTTIVRENNLLYGNTHSCGCLRLEGNHKSHGLSKTLIHNCWVSMIYRCYKRTGRLAKWYREKRIQVCEYLRESPQSLLDLIGDRPSSKHSIDRHPDMNGHYSCGNCDECIKNRWLLNVRWATSGQQTRNTNRNIVIKAFGREMLLKDWEKATGIHQSVIMRRIRRGDDPEKALGTPNRNGSCFKDV